MQGVILSKMDYQVMPPLSKDAYEELKQSIAEKGVLVAIEYDEDGNVLDGHHRLKACQELGITDYPKIVRKGLSEDEKVLHALNLNIIRRQLTPAQRIAAANKQREVISAEAKKRSLSNLNHSTIFSTTSQDVVEKEKGDRSGHVDSIIGRMTKTSEPTVTRATAVLERGTPELQQKMLSGEIPIGTAYRQLRETEKQKEPPPESVPEKKQTGRPRKTSESDAILQSVISQLKDRDSVREFTIEDLEEDIGAIIQDFLGKVRRSFDIRQDTLKKDGAKERLYTMLEDAKIEITKIEEESL